MKQTVFVFFTTFTGHGATKNMQLGMSWFKKAAEQGHPHAAYNLGYGHIKKLHSLLNKGQVYQ